MSSNITLVDKLNPIYFNKKLNLNEKSNKNQKKCEILNNYQKNEKNITDKMLVNLYKSPSDILKNSYTYEINNNKDHSCDISDKKNTIFKKNKNIEEDINIKNKNIVKKKPYLHPFLFLNLNQM